MRSFLMRKVNNITKTLSLRAKVPNTYGARLYTIYISYIYHIYIPYIYTIYIPYIYTIYIPYIYHIYTIIYTISEWSKSGGDFEIKEHD